MKSIRLLSLFMTLVMAGAVRGQEVAIKTNLIYDALTTPNLGIEIGVKERNTINLVYGLNPWTFGHTDNGVRKAKHWVLMPEIRRWFCSKFNGSFIGCHIMGGQFNASNLNIPVPGFFYKGENLRKGVRDNRYEGKFLGGGISYGFQWILNRHWNLEAEIGVGALQIWYDKYMCNECGTRLAKGQTRYAGLTKLGLSFLYLF